MISQHWNGVGNYDVLLTLSEAEMRELTEFYKVDWSFFTSGPRKNFNDRYFCFASFSRKRLALLPFLSLAFGSQYDELPFDRDVQTVHVDFKEYALEKYTY